MNDRLLMASLVEQRITLKIAEDIGGRREQVVAAIALLDEGATVPFIARYRKEVTGGLDDIQLRLLDERLSYLRELEDRRTAILASIEEQGKLTPELAKEIDGAETKQGLEDLYLPYKKKRRTKAQIAHTVEHRMRIGEAGIGVDEGRGLGQRVERRVGEQLVGQRLQPCLASDHALRAAPRLVGR